MGNTTLGILIMLVATSMINIGAVLQKKAVDRLPAFDAVPVRESIKALLRTPLWMLGWVVGTVAIVFNMLALGLADISVVQPLNGFGLVVLAVFSRLYLGERLGGRALWGISLVMVGVVAVGFVLPVSRVFQSAAEILACYTHGMALAALVVLALLAVFGWWWARLVPRWAGVLLALSAATCSVTGLTFSKGFFGLLALVGPAATLSMGSAWLLLVAVVVFSSAALALQQLSLQKGRAVVVTPVYAAVSVVLPLAVGALVFREQLPLVALAGPLFIVVGVVLLGQRAGES